MNRAMVLVQCVGKDWAIPYLLRAPMSMELKHNRKVGFSGFGVAAVGMGSVLQSFALQEVILAHSRGNYRVRAGGCHEITGHTTVLDIDRAFPNAVGTPHDSMDLGALLVEASQNSTTLVARKMRTDSKGIATSSDRSKQKKQEGLCEWLSHHVGTGITLLGADPRGTLRSTFNPL